LILFEADKLYVEPVKIEDIEDIEDIASVYNSNLHFLEKHIGVTKVETQWVYEELISMKEMEFCSCKIVEQGTGKIRGFIDYRLEKETYLSLIMLHSDAKGKGYGRLILQEFETYIKMLGSNCIRIDVVTDYDGSIMEYWRKRGFLPLEQLELNWSGRTLPAVKMLKQL
jgi:GNAT superfamily N-acetyltransferase